MRFETSSPEPPLWHSASAARETTVAAMVAMMRAAAAGAAAAAGVAAACTAAGMGWARARAFVGRLAPNALANPGAPSACSYSPSFPCPPPPVLFLPSQAPRLLLAHAR